MQSKSKTTTSTRTRTTHSSGRTVRKRTFMHKSQTFNNPFVGTNFKAQIKVKRARHKLPFKIYKTKEYFSQTKSVPEVFFPKKSQSKKQFNKKVEVKFNSTNDLDFQRAKQITTQGQEIWRTSCKEENKILAEDKKSIWRKKRNRSINSHLGDRWERVEPLHNYSRDNLKENDTPKKFIKVKHSCGNSGFIFKPCQEFENKIC